MHSVKIKSITYLKAVNYFPKKKKDDDRQQVDQTINYILISTSSRRQKQKGKCIYGMKGEMTDNNSKKRRLVSNEDGMYTSIQRLEDYIKKCMNEYLRRAPYSIGNTRINRKTSKLESRKVNKKNCIDISIDNVLQNPSEMEEIEERRQIDRLID